MWEIPRAERIAWVSIYCVRVRVHTLLETAYTHVSIKHISVCTSISMHLLVLEH